MQANVTKIRDSQCSLSSDLHRPTDQNVSDAIIFVRCILPQNNLRICDSDSGSHARKSAVKPYQRIMFSEYYTQPLNSRAPQAEEDNHPSRLSVTEAALEATTFEDLEVPTVPSSTIPKRKKGQSPTPKRNDEADNTDDYLPALDRYVSAYNSFFPIILGGYPNSKIRSSDVEEGAYPHEATAIANSFSTGEGGVASSHATAFADPSLRAMLKSGYFNQKSGMYLKN